MTYIYMNHHIRDKRNLKSRLPEPIITIQHGSARIHANAVRICGPSTVRFGTLTGTKHDVHAWIETDAVVKAIA